MTVNQTNNEEVSTNVISTSVINCKLQCMNIWNRELMSYDAKVQLVPLYGQ